MTLHQGPTQWTWRPDELIEDSGGLHDLGDKDSVPPVGLEPTLGRV